jgi:hypothetical protein
MNIKTLTIIAAAALSTVAVKSKAQTAYTQGVITYNASINGNTSQSKDYFSPDSSVYVFNAGPAEIKLLSNASYSFFAVLVNVPVASKKLAAVETPAEIEDGQSQLPSFTFAPTTETKQISGFNCKKVVATEATSKKSYDIWVTNDFTYPKTAVPVYYANAGGFPVQFIMLMQGREISITVASIVQQNLPAGTFGIPADADRITMDELKAMSGGH